MKKGRSLKEAKAEHAKRKRRKRRRKRILVLVIELILFVTLLAIGYVITRYDKFQIHIFEDGDIQMNEGVKQKKKYTTIALFGGDSREGYLEKGTHADTIILASINNKTKEVKLVSVYRDLMTMQPSGEIKKANSAYFVGGPKDAINMLNQNFDLDIQDYVTVDFKALVDAVDLLGGIEIEVSEAEAKEMNNHIAETARIAGQEFTPMKAGMQKLNGVEAVTYARIRKNVGGDYARTKRQRLVIEKLVEKLKSADVGDVLDMVDQIFPQVSTSFELTELLGYATDVGSFKLGETSGFAIEYTDGRVEGIGSVVIPLDVVKNVELLHEFLYPSDDYTPSDTVKEIAKEIEGLSGYPSTNEEEDN